MSPVRMPVVADHSVRWDDKVPVQVDLRLVSGEELSLDLVAGELTQRSGKPLPERVLKWCREIGGYLARMALATAREERGKARGGVEVDFLPQPKPGETWWG